MPTATEEVCHQAKVSVPSTSQLVNGLFKTNNYDGLKAHENWVKMNTGEKVAKAVNRDVYIFSATGIFALYQCTRLSSLSKSGKMMAPAGLGLSLLALLGVANTKAHYKALVAKPEPAAV